MALSNTETIGFAEQVTQLMVDNKDELSAKGLDVTDWITDENNLKTTAVTEIGKQDDMEAATKAQTQVAQAAVKNLYTKTSTRLDAIIGVLGKSTPLAKQAGKLRSSLIKQTRRNTNDGNNT